MQNIQILLVSYNGDSKLENLQEEYDYYVKINKTSEDLKGKFYFITKGSCNYCMAFVKNSEQINKNIYSKLKSNLFDMMSNKFTVGVSES